MAFAMMAVFSLTLVSCGDDDYDDPNGGRVSTNTQQSEDGNYSFTFNGNPYYYGGDYNLPGLGQQTSISCHYSIVDDYDKIIYGDYKEDLVTLSINAQNTPYKFFDEAGERVIFQEYDKDLEGIFRLKKFDPTKKRKGDLLEIVQDVRSHRTDTDDPKYLYDFKNYIKYSEYSGNNTTTHSHADDIKYYTWRGEPKGSIKFVSYREYENGFGKYSKKGCLTLEFENVTLDVYRGEDYSTKDQSQQAVINGTIIFAEM